MITRVTYFRKILICPDDTGSKTILWNGPAGVFEFDKFAEGSKAMLDACIEACQKGSTVIVGGGDTATVCKSTSSSRFTDYGAFFFNMSGS